MSTGRTIALIKALGGGSGGGGGGSEEQFSKVYETTLEEPAETMLIPSTDLGGIYVDMVVCMENPVQLSNDTNYMLGLFVDEDGESALGGSEGVLPAHGDWSLLVFALSNGGLLVNGETTVTINGTEGKSFFLPIFGEGPCYPTEQYPGVKTIACMMENGIPAGTKITIFARKKVA